jgi:hypothetical protein
MRRTSPKRTWWSSPPTRVGGTRTESIHLARRIVNEAKVAVLLVGDAHRWPPKRLRCEGEGLGTKDLRALSAAFGVRATTHAGRAAVTDAELLVVTVEDGEEQAEIPRSLLHTPLALLVPQPDPEETPRSPAEHDPAGGIAMMPPA